MPVKLQTVVIEELEITGLPDFNPRKIETKTVSITVACDDASDAAQVFSALLAEFKTKKEATE